MNKKPVLSNIFLFCLTTITQTAFCQFAYKADIGEVKQSGFHKIAITPAIAAKSKPDFSDIRIMDDSGKFVQYILQRDQPVFNKEEIQTIPLISTKKSRNGNTQLILEVGQDTTLLTRQESYSLVLAMEKANAYRNASISGSRDLKQWYVISDRITLDAQSNQPGNETIQVISLPSAGYRYLGIEMYDKGLVPVKIVKSGFILNKSIYGNYTLLPSPRLVQKDSSNHKSYITIHFNDTYPVSKIHFTVESSALYKRKIIVYDTSGISGRMLAEGIASPGMDSLILAGEKVKYLVMVVENNDNQPIRFSNVYAYQLQHSLIAHLLQGKNYSIVTGNRKATAPVYDLSYFKDSIRLTPEELNLQDPQPYQNHLAEKTANKNIVTMLWVWVPIGIVLLALIWLSFRLIKDISNKRQ